jgi:hypothetical protein
VKQKASLQAVARQQAFMPLCSNKVKPSQTFKQRRQQAFMMFTQITKVGK